MVTPRLELAELHAAADRLRGHLVLCPVIGDLLLPGFDVPPGLRIKAELLQPGGLWFRGAQHWLMRQFGRCLGLELGGDDAALTGWAFAARTQRTPTVARVPGPSAALHEVLATAGCVVVEAPPEQGDESEPYRRHGFVRVPPPDATDFALGVATIALELAVELPSHTGRIVVGPSALAEAVRLGVASLGLPWEVVAAPASHSSADSVARALSRHHRLCTTEVGGAALAFALELPASDDCSTAVVLGV